MITNDQLFQVWPTFSTVFSVHLRIHKFGPLWVAWNFRLLDFRFKTKLKPWRSGLCSGIVVSACQRGDWSWGSWDRIPPGHREVAFLIQTFLSVLAIQVRFSNSKKSFTVIERGSLPPFSSCSCFSRCSTPRTCQIRFLTSSSSYMDRRRSWGKLLGL
jgi:hypothetical protein